MPELEPVFDHVFRNAAIVDGTGAAPVRGDVAVKGDRIAAVAGPGEIESGAGRFEHELDGRALAPGFIDVHTHDDRIVLDAPDMLPKISQGVTTVVIGNCGISLAPLRLEGDPPPPLNLLGGREAYCFERFADYRAAVRAAVPAVNVAALVGHSSLRVGTMTDVARPADMREQAAMLERLDEALDAGAIGFSTGLFYPTNRAAGIDEVAPLAARTAERGGIYATHMRDEHDRVLESLDETFRTAARAHASVVVSHHKCAGPRNWGRTVETLPAIEVAASRQPVSLDAYPYRAGSTVLDPAHVTGDIRIMVTWSKAHPGMAGRNLDEIASEWGVDQKEAARRLDPAGAVYFQMDEEDVRRVIAFPRTMIGSDGLPHDSHPHPRLWGTFPRVIGHYGRELRLFPLETAIAKMTGLPAATFRLEGRGRIAKGWFADLVVFDPERIIDRATFEDPKRPAAGIDLVMVNGVESWRGGTSKVDRAGRFLERGAASPR